MSGGLCGAAMVVRGRDVLSAVAGGPVDIDTAPRCTPTTRFQVASVSKQFTAAAALILAGSGRLDLHEPVDGWLPGASPQWRHVTLHHLLSHTAGVPHWHGAPGLDPAAPEGMDRLLRDIVAAPLRRGPGQAWHYSSPGFILVGTVLERATGRLYADLVTELILSPVQMTDTTVGPPPVGAARGHRADRPVPPLDLTRMAGTGDIWSTAADLIGFTTALHLGDLLEPGSRAAMCSTHARLTGEVQAGRALVPTGYGYGMFVGVYADRLALYHPGDVPGYRSLGCWFPADEVGVVILTNDEATDMADALRNLLSSNLGW